MTSFVETYSSSLLAEFRKTVTDNPWIPWAPTRQQALFLANLHDRECLYGGAAGGGKSVALLLAALQYVDVPEYSALLLRRTFPDLYKPKALVPLSHALLASTAARWDGSLHQWTFPSGAKLSFGHCNTENDKYNYQGAEYQFIGFDELTHFTLTQYLYITSRLRKPTGMNVPTRIRASANPGGVGHEWVKARFIEPRDHRRCSFVPAKLEDNPYLDQEDYEESLGGLDPVTRAQLRHGDWTVHADGSFKRAWLRYWKRDGEFARLITGGDDRVYRIDALERFATADIAGTEKKADNEPDWTVMQVWGLSQNRDLVLLDQLRVQAETPDVETAIIRAVRKHELDWIAVESNGIGLPVVQSLRRRGIAVRGIKAHASKIVRAQGAQIRMEAGTVFFPTGVEWVADLESELFLFPDVGHDDQVDALSHACIYVQRHYGSPPSPPPNADELAIAARKEAQAKAAEEQRVRDYHLSLMHWEPEDD